MPAETKAVAGTIKMLSADDVAKPALALMVCRAELGLTWAETKSREQMSVLLLHTVLTCFYFLIFVCNQLCSAKRQT